MLNSVIVYKDDEQRSIPAIDLQGWHDDGWSTNPPSLTENPSEEEGEKESKKARKPTATRETYSSPDA